MRLPRHAELVYGHFLPSAPGTAADPELGVGGCEGHSGPVDSLTCFSLCLGTLALVVEGLEKAK